MVGRRLFRRRWLFRRRRFEFRHFLVAALALALLGTAWRFGLRRAEEAPVPETLAQLLGPSGGPALATGPEEIRAALERLRRLGMPVRCGGGRQPVVALTFDDGPGPWTARIEGILARSGVPATFFVVGNRLAARGRGLVRGMGPVHVVGSHSWSHASFRDLPPGARRAEVVRSQRALAAALGSAPRLFRPPFGHRDARLDRLLARMGLVEVLWSATAGDNRPTTRGRILERLGREVRPGAILLLHERPASVRALPRVLETIRRRGLRPVTVPELLALDPPTARQLRHGYCTAGAGPDFHPAEVGGGRP